MSALLKKSKKRLSQPELRKYMNEYKNKQKDTKKIESPLAKYNDQGQLTCILCQSVVRSESVWTVHVNAKIHKQNVEKAKKLKERTNNFTTPLKRPLTPPLDISNKKIKGILKNSNSSDPGITRIEPEDNETQTINLPITKRSDIKSIQKKDTEDISGSKDSLPEGFFDDPKLDAKARNQEYSDPVEEEWDKFIKAIKEADNESNAIIAEDQEESTTERQIDEIDKQIKILSRVLDLEKKKIQTISKYNDIIKSAEHEESEEDVEEGFDEFLDWRAKKSFK